MFLWVRLPEGLTGEGLFDDALREKVAFVPGSSFFAGAPDPRYIRLNFSNRTPELIDEGMRRLGRVIAARMDAPR
jgi:2-aminoadipate transaminase